MQKKRRKGKMMSGWFNPEVEKRDHIDNLEYKEKDKEDRRMSSA